MKTNSVHPVYQAIRSDHTLYSIPRLVVEWNLNRYFPVVASNGPSAEEYDYDVELFPIESVVQSNRPTKGIVKARVNEAVVADNYVVSGQVARFYLADRDDIYKYWCSPMPSDGTGAMPTWADFAVDNPDFADDVTVTTAPWSTQSVCQPFIQYEEALQSNKIVVGFENTWASPSAFTVQVQATVGGAWTTIATNPVIRNDGRVVLYNTATGWTPVETEPEVSVMTPVAGVKVVVTALSGGIDTSGNSTYYTQPTPDGTGYTQTATTGSNSFCNIIEISARREENITDWLISTSDTFDIGETSPITPIGTISSNVSSITLSNINDDGTVGKFNSHEPGSPYAELLDSNAEFRLEYVYYSDVTMTTEIGRILEFKMYSAGPWNGSRGPQIEVSLVDVSKFLQEVKPHKTMFENMPVEQIIWRICDQIGFTDYDVVSLVNSVPTFVPYWWTDGEQTAWELFNDLAVNTQTAVYVSHDGRLQIVNREAAFSAAQTPVWDLYGEQPPAGILPDIETITPTEQLQANKITISYQKTDVSDWNNGHPKLDVVWEPEGDSTVLRAADLRRTLTLVDTFFWITSADAQVWPYEGIVNIEGELLKYKGKHFVYYEGGQRKTVTVNDADEYELYNNKTATIDRYKNYFTGGMKIDERGYWNSEAKTHSVDATGYSVRSIRNGVRRIGVAGFKHNKTTSTVSLRTTPKRFRPNDILIATRGAAGDQGWYFMGTRMRFVSDGRTQQRGGIVFGNSDNDEAGYYLELQPTLKIGSKERNGRNEVIFYTREADGTQKRHTGNGTRAAIVENRWLDIDVAFRFIGADHRIIVWLNGRRIIDKTISGLDRAAFNGRFGMFVRGDSHVEYEYLYGINRIDDVPADDMTFFDVVDGGYRSDMWDREWVYRWKKLGRRARKRSGRARMRYNRYFFDEFGPIVHEVREFNVNLDPAPVTHSRLFLTNLSGATVTEYRAGPFDAHFVIANTSRTNSVVRGEDSMFAAGSGEAVNQILAVVGRVVTQEEAEEKVIENAEMIRRRGIIESEISGPWIQSEAAADRLGEWIKSHWSLGTEQFEASVFGNPLFEIGDVVTVNHAEADMFGDRCYVVGISNSFEQGLTTTLTLRKVV